MHVSLCLRTTQFSILTRIVPSLHRALLWGRWKRHSGFLGCTSCSDQLLGEFLVLKQTQDSREVKILESSSLKKQVGCAVSVVSLVGAGVNCSLRLER